MGGTRTTKSRRIGLFLIRKIGGFLAVRTQELLFSTKSDHGGFKSIFRLFIGLFFLSGIAGLAYQVLWFRELKLLFGFTSYASSTILISFFVGFSAGSYFWGERVGQYENPLKVFAFLEGSVGLSSLGYFLLSDFYQLLLFKFPDLMGTVSSVHLPVKLFVSLIFLVPPAFFMGGTFPVLSHYFERGSERFGQVSTFLYATNTFGGGFGAFLVGFFLIPRLGVNLVYVFLVATSFGIALLAWFYGGCGSNTVSDLGERIEPSVGSLALSWQEVQVLSFISGGVILALEVLFTVMLEQILQNSTYSFSIILAVFLSSLGLGAYLSHYLVLWGTKDRTTLYVLIAGTSVSIVLAMIGFGIGLDSAKQILSASNWSVYSLKTVGLVFVLIGPSSMMGGTVFPYLLKLARAGPEEVGSRIGLLVSLNTLGCILGALGAGYFALETVGLWPVLKILSVAYFLLGTFVLSGSNSCFEVSPLLVMALFGSLVYFLEVPLVQVNPVKAQVIEEVYQGPAGITAVVRQGNSKSIKVNNTQVLGGTGRKGRQQTLAHLPMLLHPNPKKVFFLGLGTGVTAGASLKHKLKSVDIAEINAGVIKAVKKHFDAYTEGLFTDPIATVLNVDGRSYLRATQKRYDVIVGDLFFPWKVGVGVLYSEEHFRTVRERLSDNGLFVQWVPLYQLTRTDVGIIARTVSEVFPEVKISLVGDPVDNPVMGFFAQKDEQKKIIRDSKRLEAIGGDITLAPPTKSFYDNSDETQETIQISPEETIDNQVLETFYVGDLSCSSEVLRTFPVNREDWPVIEYRSPKQSTIYSQSGRVMRGDKIRSLLREWNLGCQ